MMNSLVGCRRGPTTCTVCLFCILPLFVCAPVLGQPDATAPEGEKAAYWLERLADSNYETRSQATIELCKLGPAAISILERAAKDAPPEVAFRAQHLLETLANLYFAGAEINLKTTSASVAWNEPFDLIIQFRNPGSYPVRLPFDKPAGNAGADSTAAQVSAVFDVADMLRVTGPDGQPLSLHVDDIRQDAAVAAVVEQRLTQDSVSTLAPGDALELRISDINRGWARFPLLKSGTYQFQFSYEPEWNEPALQSSRAGVVEAKPCELEVKQGAPEDVAGPDGPCRLTAVVTAGSIELLLTNRFDVDIHVNLNFGSSLKTFAGLQLRLVSDDDMASVDLGPLVGADGKYSKARIVRVGAGEKLSFAKLEMDALTQRCAGLKLTDSPTCMIQFEYVNLIDAAWQQERNRPAGVDTELLDSIRSDPLPARMLTGRVAGDSVQAGQLFPDLRPKSEK